MFPSRYLPCSDCGASLDRTDPAPHVCDGNRMMEFQMFGLRHEVARFDGSLRRYLDTVEGRFEAWLAAREVRRPA